MSSIKEKFNQISPSEFFYSNRDLAGFSNPTVHCILLYENLLKMH